MKIVYLGRYNSSKKLTAPEKFSKRIFFNMSEINNDVVFIEYFFKQYQSSSLLNRFFGKTGVCSKPLILRLGSIRILFFLLKNQPDLIHILTAERFTLPIYIYKCVLKSRVITTFHSVLKYEIPNDRMRSKKFNIRLYL